VRKRHTNDAIIDQTRLKAKIALNGERFLKNESEANLFLNALKPGDQSDIQQMNFYGIALIMLRCGLRVSEAAALCWDAVELDGEPFMNICRTVHWERFKGGKSVLNGTTKNGEPRRFPIISEVASFLKAWKLISGRTSGLIFGVSELEVVKYRAVQYRFNRAFKACGMPYTATHLLRTTFATNMQEYGSAERAISVALGHKDFKMTRHYAKPTDPYMRENVGRFETGLRLVSSQQKVSDAG
jgi:integrase